MIVTKRLMTLSEPVAAELDKELNKSALVDALLAKYFNVQIPEEDSVAYRQRHAIMTELPSFKRLNTDELQINYFGSPIAEALDEPPVYVPLPPEDDEGVEPSEPTPADVVKAVAEIRAMNSTCPTCGQLKLTSLCLTCDL